MHVRVVGVDICLVSDYLCFFFVVKRVCLLLFVVFIIAVFYSATTSLLLLTSRCVTFTSKDLLST